MVRWTVPRSCSSRARGASGPSSRSTRRRAPPCAASWSWWRDAAGHRAGGGLGTDARRARSSAIESNLDFLVTSLQDAGAAPQLRAVFDQSWNMLSAGEQEVPSGCRRCPAASATKRRAVANVSLPTLLDLVDKSLLRRTSTGATRCTNSCASTPKTTDALPPAANVRRLRRGRCRAALVETKPQPCPRRKKRPNRCATRTRACAPSRKKTPTTLRATRSSPN